MKKISSILILFPILLVACSKTDNSVINEEQTVIDDGKIVLHTAVQRAFLKGPNEDINLYVRGAEELSRPLTPTITWAEVTEPYSIFLYEINGDSDALTFSTDTNSLTLSNLKIATDYRYKVYSSGQLLEENTFSTSNEIIRNIYISGVTNARDLGGYVTSDGIIKQGLLYRTARLNENSEEEVTNRITSTGIDTMLNDLKVKTEIDLRMVSDNEVGGLKEGIGVLGETVKYYQCPMEYTSTMDKDDNDASLRKVFSILGNKNNYPAFFHCSIGTDRTGYIAWLINSCLGLEEEYLWRDYLFSNFGRIGGARDKSYIEDGYVKVIKETEGNSLKEKTINYLLAKGVKQSEIDVIREMLLA